MESTNRNLEELLVKQNELLEENNRILKRLQRFEIIGIWTKVIWYALLIGIPFALYYYFLEPYFTALGSSYETFSAGIHEIPGLKYLEEIINQMEHLN